MDSNIPESKHAFRPSVYGSYDEVFGDAQVDIVYIGTPHALHKKNCLDALAARKHVLCEKPFTINAREAREVLDAAKASGCFIMEAMWLRFRPIVDALRQRLFVNRSIGDVRRLSCDLSMDMNFQSLPANSRLKDPALGAGSLLDLGIYCITWALLGMEETRSAQLPLIVGTQALQQGVDTMTTAVLHFPDSGRHAVISSSMEVQTPERFCVIEGSEGIIEVYGYTSVPTHFYVHPKYTISPDEKIERDPKSSIPAAGILCDFREKGQGFYYEADAVALDIAAGRTDSSTMPHAETLRVMEIMDEIRRQGGGRFPQDE